MDDKRLIHSIVIHHSATTGVSTNHDAVKKYHVEERGWSDIAYHYTIDWTGIVRKGREDNVIGAHCKNFNKNSLGICLFGNFENEFPTQEQIDTLITLLKRLQETYKISSGSIFGHRDKGATACCGKHLYGLLPWIRTQLQQNPERNS